MVVLPEPEGAENIISFPFDMDKDKQIFTTAKSVSYYDIEQ